MTVKSENIASANRTELINHFSSVRKKSEQLCQTLEIEDYGVQTIEDVSPPKWHLGHTTWFFERVILQDFESNFKPYDDNFYFIFNSYYESFGNRLQRVKRGTLSRPTVKEVFAYRKAITNRMAELLDKVNDQEFQKIKELTLVGINHEQQHQELFLTDIKNIFYNNVILPKLTNTSPTLYPKIEERMLTFKGGLIEIGAQDEQFAYDNEMPVHQVFVKDFKLSNKLVTCGEFLEFIRDNGYQNPILWLSDGWDWVNRETWQQPWYWVKEGDDFMIYTLGGLKPLDLNEPVCHLSHHEAYAYARWRDKRLPTEFEWEHAANSVPLNESRGTFSDDNIFHPSGEHIKNNGNNLNALFGDVWEWTSSAYLPYPGYKQPFDALGEYNGKFMNAQMVLRGGSCATSLSHFRKTYRNFFQSEKKWQFTGLRLAEDV